MLELVGGVLQLESGERLSEASSSLHGAEVKAHGVQPMPTLTVDGKLTPTRYQPTMPPLRRVSFPAGPIGGSALPRGWGMPGHLVCFEAEYAEPSFCSFGLLAPSLACPLPLARGAQGQGMVIVRCFNQLHLW